MYARGPKHSPVIGPGLVPAPAGLPYDDPQSGPTKPSAQLPLSGAPAFAIDPAALPGSQSDPRKHTQTPYVTGNSVVAFTYADGVIIACDTLGSYGSTKRYKSVQRIFQVNKRCVVGASGEISDFQQIQKYLDELAEDDFIAEDGIQWTPKELHSYLTRVMYNRRDKFDPLWNSLIVAGVEPDGQPFAGMVSMIGVQYTDTCVCTGFAAHLALPLLRKYQAPDMSEANAKDLMEDALRVCFYRDKDSINRFIMVTVTKDAVTFGEPMAVPTNWNFKIMQNPTKFSPGSW